VNTSDAYLPLPILSNGDASEGEGPDATLPGAVPERRAMQDFARILRSAQCGRENAFAALWTEFNPSLRRYLSVMAGQAADDIAADTWSVVASSLGRFEGDESGFRAWLYTIARHRHIDMRRREARRRESFLDENELSMSATRQDVENLAEEAIGTEAALRLIASLPPDQAEAVALRVIGGLDVARVADMMGRTPSTVRVLTHRGLKKLASTLVGGRSATAGRSLSDFDSQRCHT